MLTGGLIPGSSGVEEAQGLAVELRGGQVRRQALTYIDGFIVIAWTCAGTIVLIALMRRTRIYFDARWGELPR